MDANRKRWFGLPFVALGVALIIVDSTIVNVSIPSIFEELKISSTQAQWIQESYTLVFASLLLLFGRLADRFGRRRMFQLGLILFSSASVLAAMSGSGDALIASRLLQGVGGAMMLPNSLSILNSTFFGKDRGIAFAVWGSTIGAAAAFGPLLGGWLTTSFSWRWAFGINIPFCIIILIGIQLFINESKSQDERQGADVIGALLSVLGIGAIVFGLIEGRSYGWWTPIGENSFFLHTWTLPISVVAVAFIIGSVFLAIFIGVEVRRNKADQPVLLDLHLLRVKSFRSANLVAGIVSLGEFGLLFALPLWLQNVLGYTAFETGLLLLSLAVGSFFASGASAGLGPRIGAIAIVRLGIVLEIIGIAVCGFVVSPSTSAIAVMIPLFFYGAGVGFATAQLTGVALAEIPPAESGQASGVTSTTRQLGSALGIAILGTVLFTSFGSVFDAKMENSTIPEQQRAQLSADLVSSAGAMIPALKANPATESVAAAAGEALSEGTRRAAYLGAGFLVIGWLMSLTLGKSVPIRDEQPSA